MLSRVSLALLLAACSRGGITPGTSSAPSASPASSASSANATAPGAAPASGPALEQQAAPLSEAQAITLASQDASGDADGTDARYFSMAYVESLSLTSAQVGTVRKGLAKLLNSLSWSAGIVVPQVIDQGQTLYKIHLKDYGWTPALWESIAEQYPTMDASIQGLAALSAVTGTSKPVLRAEWFVNNASVPPLYQTVLGLPTDFNQLQTMVPVDIGQDVRNQNVLRAGYNNSIVSTNDRIIERHALNSGGFLWRSYEFGTTTGAQDIFTSPLGPVRYFSGADAGGPGGGLPFGGPQSTQNMFSDDGGEVYFTLPNGLIAFYITDGSDTSLTTVPGAAHGPIFAGYSCMACHASGPIAKADMVAAAVASGTSTASVQTPGPGKPPGPPPGPGSGNNGLSATDLQAVAKLYVPAAVLSQQVQSDQAAYQAGLAKLGLAASDGDPVSKVVTMNIPED